MALMWLYPYGLKKKIEYHSCGLFLSYKSNVSNNAVRIFTSPLLTFSWREAVRVKGLFWMSKQTTIALNMFSFKRALHLYTDIFQNI